MVERVIKRRRIKRQQAPHPFRRRQGKADQIGPPPGRHAFLSRCHVGGAHGSGLLATAATTVALIEVAGESVILLGVAELGAKRQFIVPLENDSEVLINGPLRSTKDLSRVHQVLRIKTPLERFHGGEHSRRDVV